MLAQICRPCCSDMTLVVIIELGIDLSEGEQRGARGDQKTDMSMKVGSEEK